MTGTTSDQVLSERQWGKPHPGIWPFIVLYRCFNGFAGKLAVYLGSRDVSVSQQFLHRAQFHAVLQHENGERVAQHVRGDIRNVGLPGIALNDEPEALTCQPLAMMVDEEGLLVWMVPG